MLSFFIPIRSTILRSRSIDLFEKLQQLIFNSYIGLRTAVIIGGFVNTIYIGLLIFAPKAVPIYIFSVIIGIGGSLIWVGQGTILIVNSTAATIGRNTGIFYFMFESSLG